jgi:hypothetical protein
MKFPVWLWRVKVDRIYNSVHNIFHFDMCDNLVQVFVSLKWRVIKVLWLRRVFGEGGFMRGKFNDCFEAKGLR